jgi:hypothetical protein
MMKWIGVTVVVAAVAEMAFSYGAPSSGTGAWVEDETVTTTSVERAGVVTGGVTER